MKLFVLAPCPLLQDFRSSSSQRPGISKDYEHGKSWALSGSFIAPRNSILVFHFFSVGNLGYLQSKYGLQNVSAGSQIYFQSCTLCRRSREYLKLCRQFWQCRGKLHPSQSDGFDWMCPLHTQHATMMQKRFR